MPETQTNSSILANVKSSIERLQPLVTFPSGCFPRQLIVFYRPVLRQLKVDFSWWLTWMTPPDRGGRSSRNLDAGQRLRLHQACCLLVWLVDQFGLIVPASHGLNELEPVGLSRLVLCLPAWVSSSGSLSGCCSWTPVFVRMESLSPIWILNDSCCL